jgi:DNA-binding CsgD family transcriptional regulator/PAS domain-containing protein
VTDRGLVSADRRHSISDLALRSGENGLDSLIDRIYASVEQPELWPETIVDIGRLVGGGDHFWSVDRSRRSQPNPLASEAACHGTFLLSRADLRELDQYAAEYDNLIVRFLRLVFLSVLWSQKDIGAREALGARMIRRYLQGREASRSDVHGARPLIAAMWEDGRMFDLRHLHHMQLLAPHLDRAARLQMRLNLVTLRSELVSGALDSLTLGVIVVDQAGSKIWHNRRAEEIATDPKVLTFSGPRLVGRDASSTQSVRDLICRAVAGEPGLLPIERDSSKPLLLLATPLRPAGMYDVMARPDEIGYGVVFVSDPDRTDNFTVESLQRAFDLTYREAQTAIAIARGQGLKIAARAMGVAPTTARSQLQQVFAKTGTNHQAELAALVHRTFTQVQ